MSRIFALFFFISLVNSAFSQSQGNPFDLKYRPAKPKTTEPSKPKVQDTAEAVNLVIEKDPGKSVIPDTNSTIANQNRGSNPFEKKVEPAHDTTFSVVPEAHPNKAVEKEPPAYSPKKKTSKGLQIFFLLLSLLLLIFIVNVEKSFVKDLWKVISNENYSSLHLRNQRNTMRQILLLMGYMVFFIQAGIFLFHTLNAFHYRGTLLDNIWTCMLLIISVYGIRHAAIRYLRWLFNNEKEMTLFGFDVSIFNIMVGLVLLPINVMLNFGPESLAKPLIYLGLITCILAYLMRQLRWMLTARQLITNSLFLFFVYLCAVEILPLWAISKFFW